MTSPAPMKHLVFEGMKHCGKSTHGRYIAQHLGWPFFDTDELMIDGFSKQMLERPTIRDIFNTLGEAKFESLEEQLILKLAERLRQTDKRCVIALGGRAPAKFEMHPVLHELGKVVYIRVPHDILYKRASRRRPVTFVDPTRPEAHFKEIYDEREKAYTALADVTVTLNDISIHEAQRLILSEIESVLGSWLKS